MSVSAHNMADKDVKTNADTQVFPANKTASDNPSDTPAKTAAETLNILQGKLHARRQHCQALIEWVYAETTSIDKLCAYILKRFGFNPKNLEKSKIQIMLKALFEQYINEYTFYLEQIEKNMNVDDLFICFKSRLVCGPLLVSNRYNAYFLKNKKKEEELEFIDSLKHSLTPLLSPATRDLSKYIVFDSDQPQFNSSGLDMARIVKEHIDDVWKPAIDLLNKIVGNNGAAKLNFLIKSSIENRFIAQYGIKFKFFNNGIERLKDKLMDFITIQNENTNKARQTGEAKPEDEIKRFKEMRDNLLEIQKYMLSCKDFYKKFNSEVNQRQSIYKAKKIIKEQFELIEPLIKELGALKDLPAYKSTLLQKMLNEANNTLRSIHVMLSENNAFFTYVENIFETETDLTSTKFLFVQSIENQTNFQKQCSDLKQKISDLKAAALKDALKLAEEQSATVTPAKVATESASEPKSNTIDPNSKKETRNVPAKRPSTKAEWDAKVLAEKLEKAKEQKKHQDERLAEILHQIDLKQVREQMRTLSEVELKRREERIQSFLKTTPTIKSLFNTLYYGHKLFGHNELLGLIHALKVQGENIELQSPSGGSSHYTVLIGVGCYGYIDEEFIEKGKAFTPHNKNFSGFQRHIIESLQNTFTRAGYSPEALGLSQAVEAAVGDAATASVAATNNKPAKQ